MTTSRADSPCVDLCIYDYDRDFCTGCGRTLDEVSYWNYFTPQEKQQILMWIEKKTKTNNSEILTKEIKRMPFIILSPQGEVINIDPLQ